MTPHEHKSALTTHIGTFADSENNSSVRKVRKSVSFSMDTNIAMTSSLDRGIVTGSLKMNPEHKPGNRPTI